MKKACLFLSLITLLASCQGKGEVSSSFSSSPSSIETPSSVSSEEERNVVRYYFDSSSEKGGDGSLEKPFSSLKQISNLTLEPGTEILIKRGSSFKGQFSLKDIHGEKRAPIIVSSYGEGALPKIDGNDQTGEGVLYLSNCSNIVIKNLEIFDSAKYEDDRRGVLVELSSHGKDVETYENITLDGLYVHDIYGYSDKNNAGMAMSSKVTGGIHIWSTDGKAKSKNFTIKNCKIDNVSNVGIASWYQVNGDKVKKVSPYDSSFQKTAHENLLITNNEISNIAKNAVFLRNAYDSKIENNVVHDTATTCKAGNSIVTSFVDKITIQYNEGYRNMATTQDNGILQDGAMLDSDLQSKEVLFQYNYSHDNAFGLFLNCDAQNLSDPGAKDQITLRYNVSIHDQGQKGIIFLNYYVGKVSCYNNTIITSVDSPILLQVKNDRTLDLYNNLFYSTGKSPSVSLGNQNSVTMESNLFYTKSNLQGRSDLEYAYDFDPKPRNRFEEDISSRIGRDNGIELAYMEEDKLFDPENCVDMDLPSKPVDIADHPFAPSIGAINRKNSLGQ